MRSNRFTVYLQPGFNLEMYSVDVFRGLGLSELAVGGRVAKMVTEGS